MTRNVMERTGEQRWPNGQGQKLNCPRFWIMSASLIGHLGSSTFRLSATAVSMSLAGS
jgi:hypothetical protein